MSAFLTTKQVAGRFGVGVNTVQKWIGRGLLRAELCPCGQAHLVKPADLRTFQPPDPKGGRPRNRTA